MHDIDLLYLVPLHDEITFVVFRDRTLDTVDCSLLRNQHRALMPSLNPELSDGVTDAVLALEEILKAEIGASQYREYPDGELIAIELDDALHQQMVDRCKLWDLTEEKLLQAFLRFCKAENRNVLKRWILDLRREEMYQAFLFASEHRYSQSEFEQSFDEIMGQVEVGLSPILIIGNEENSMLVFQWEDYWKRVGWLYPPGEKERIEEQCRQATAANNQE